MNTLLITTIVLALIVVVPYAFLYFIEYYGNKNDLFKDMVPKPVDKSRLCKYGHAWINAAMINENKQLVETNVCADCGLIPNKDLMVSKKGMDAVLQSNKEKEISEMLEKEFITSEEEQLKLLFAEELKNGVSMDKLWGVYVAGSSSYSRYAFFKMAKLEEMQKPKEGAYE